MSPSKTMAARRQMRTPGERTSGAWTGGCVIHPDGGDETDRTAGNSYTATPHNTQAITAGADVYWDNTNGVITATAESNILAGYAIADAAAADAVVSIKINA